MFHDIPAGMAERMNHLEAIDARDRTDGSAHDVRLRQVSPDTGRFLAILAASAPAGEWLEIGTSGGYSGLWLSLAARATGRKLTTFEFLEPKAALARETFRQAGVEAEVELVTGDARQHISSHDRIGFCFLDAEKSVYQDCYDLIVPRLVPGGILAADNVISHREHLVRFMEAAAADKRVDVVTVPIGCGILLCRKL